MKFTILLLNLFIIFNLHAQIQTCEGVVASVGGYVVKAGFSNNQYVTVNGSDEKVTFTSITLTKPFSISMWVNLASFANQTIVGNSAGTNNAIYFANATSIVYKFGSSSTSITHGLTFTTNTWQLFSVVVASDGTITTYRNGIAGGTTGSNTTNLIVNQAFMSGLTTKYNGKADELALYTKALNPTEVLQIYNGGTPQQTSNCQDISGGTKLYYRFEGNLSDSSPSNYTGTGQNMDLSNYTLY